MRANAVRARFRAAALALAVGTLAGCPAALAAEVRVLCPSALRTPVVESARQFARAGRHRIEFVFASVAAVHKRIATGERADVVIGTAHGIDALIRLGRGIEGSRVPLVRSALALALPAGEAVPDIRDPIALAAVLQRAHVLVVPDASLGVPGGAQAAQLFERLGLTEQLRERTRFVVDAHEVGTRVAAGRADVGVGAMSELVSVPGIALLGPITEPRTEGIAYAAAVVRTSANAELARAFIAHLRLPESQALFRKTGYLPIDQTKSAGDR
ncbi:MAG: substrate-binding domain-containing protein [Burkholderiales bacterium]|nr:substrate-binding domain-containing protein [Burkholderiales bacterium]